MVAAPLDVRAGFCEAGEAFVAAVAATDPARYGSPASPQWTVLDLIGHATRAFSTTVEAVGRPVDDATPMLEDAAAYFRAAFAVPGVHAGIEARAHEAALALADDPPTVAAAELVAANAVVTTTDLDRVVQHALGRLRLADYLVTRVVELVLHTADLQLALGVAPTVPTLPASIARDVVVALADRAEPLAVACALAGRAGLRCDVLR